jgi:hypothetical protein
MRDYPMHSPKLKSGKTSGRKAGQKRGPKVGAVILARLFAAEFPREKRFCGARTRSGAPCRTRAMKNGRCRMHGGLSLSGEKSPRFKHGHYTREAIAQRRRFASLMADARKTIRMMRAQAA